jgi:hypothetical protein
MLSEKAHSDSNEHEAAKLDYGSAIQGHTAPSAEGRHRGTTTKIKTEPSVLKEEQ